MRRPAGPWTDAVDTLLAHLHAVGFAGAPKPLGRDALGRQVLEYVSRLWELAYAAQSMAGLRPGRDVRESAVRLRAFVDGYGLDEPSRAGLAAMLGRRARAMYELLRTGARDGRQPWARIWLQDGPYWLATADYLDANTARWQAACDRTGEPKLTCDCRSRGYYHR